MGAHTGVCVERSLISPMVVHALEDVDLSLVGPVLTDFPHRRPSAISRRGETHVRQDYAYQYRLAPDSNFDSDVGVPEPTAVDTRCERLTRSPEACAGCSIYRNRSRQLYIRQRELGAQ